MAAMVGISSAVSAQGPLDEPWQKCDNKDAQFPEVESIAGCSAIIEDGTEPASQLAIAYSNRANAYVRLQQVQRAMADYDAAVRYDPNLAEAFYNRAVLATALEDFVKAKADADEAIRLRPDLGAAWLQRGIVQALSKNFRAAIDDFSEVIRLEPQAADAYLNRGYAKLEAGMKAEGEADVAKAKSIDPTIDQ
jgi:tetratricopeptide (TPR) repeat protein